MNDLRAAAQMALDALESATPKYTRERKNGMVMGGALDYWRLEQHIRMPTIEALRAALEQGEPEPVAYDVQKALYRAYVLGQKYWADADSESYSRNKRADKHRQDFETLCEEALFCTTPPQREWQGLTDAEVEEAFFEIGQFAKIDLKTFARAIEAKLKEKNA